MAMPVFKTCFGNKFRSFGAARRASWALGGSHEIVKCKDQNDSDLDHYHIRRKEA